MKAIIFDMDGVLFDTERMSARLMKELGSEMGITISDEFIRNQCSVSAEEYVKNMCREFGDDFDLDSFNEEYFRRFPRLLEAELPMKPGVRELLTAAKERGLKLAVASSTRYAQVQANLERTELLPYFDAVYGGDLVVESKPNPEIYQKAAAAIDLPTTECFAIEDSRNGVRSASAAGCKTILVPDLTPPDDELRELTFAVCESLLDVIALL